MKFSPTVFFIKFEGNRQIIHNFAPDFKSMKKKLTKCSVSACKLENSWFYDEKNLWCKISFSIFLSIHREALFYGYRGGESPVSNPYFKAKPKLSVFENGQFSGHFFLDPKFSNKCKMLWGKSFRNFFDTQKRFFFRTLFGA